MMNLRRLSVSLLLSAGFSTALASGCAPSPEVPAHPTWVDVEPILRGQCTGCHGPTAAVTGSTTSAVYRLDFYEVNADVCGPAAAAMTLTNFAKAWAPLIKSDITVPPACTRARMPPAPALGLEDWETTTLLRWTDHPDKGDPQRNDTLPDIHLSASSAIADKTLSFTAIIDDPDGDPAIGVLNIGNLVFKMDHPGAFSATIDTSSWPNGPQPISATVCDGWKYFTYTDLGNVQIKHGK
jgi:hypothetical protein